MFQRYGIEEYEGGNIQRNFRTPQPVISYKKFQTSNPPSKNKNIILNVDKTVAKYIQNLRKRNGNLLEKLQHSLAQREKLKKQLHNCTGLFNRVNLNLSGRYVDGYNSLSIDNYNSLKRLKEGEGNTLLTATSKVSTGNNLYNRADISLYPHSARTAIK